MRRERRWGLLAPWAEVIDRAWQSGARHQTHLVSDGDAAIAAGIEWVYGRETPHQRCVFHLLREYRRNIGAAGLWRRGGCWMREAWWVEAKGYAARVLRATGGGGVLVPKGVGARLRHLETGKATHRTPSRLERHNRELRQRERLGRYERSTTCWRCCKSGV